MSSTFKMESLKLSIDQQSQADKAPGGGPLHNGFSAGSTKLGSGFCVKPTASLSVTDTT